MLGIGQTGWVATQPAYGWLVRCAGSSPKFTVPCGRIEICDAEIGKARRVGSAKPIRHPGADRPASPESSCRGHDSYPRHTTLSMIATSSRRFDSIHAALRMRQVMPQTNGKPESLMPLVVSGWTP